ncbi:MAG: hypothetical protein IPK66_14640 [Rhodospirillales bacterium]|nr:hypothetical protein [Rhodospirillales bacterium]
MRLKCVAKLFALEPKANAIEARIIATLVIVAVFSTALAIRDPLISFYEQFVGDFVVGSR